MIDKSKLTYVTEECFDNNINLPSSTYEHNYTIDELKEYKKCMTDPVYFALTYMQIINVDEGLIPFRMWDFQKDMLQSFYENRFNIAKMPRQVGKTTVSVAFLLHSILFNENYRVAILANRLQTAREIMGRLELAYENLPLFLKQGVVEWNKGNIKLANGSEAMSDATSGDAIRGRSLNVVFLDEFAFVPKHIAEKFFTATYPTISSGKTTKIIMVSTPNGMNHFYKFWEDAVDKSSDYVPFEVHWSMVPGRDEAWKQQTIKNTSPEQFEQEFECYFLGSSNTLINGAFIRTQMKGKKPIAKEGNLDIYEHPQHKHTYVMTVDVAEGQNLDYSTFVVIDVTEAPYRLVAKFRDNKMPPMLFPTTIYAVASRYNMAYVLVEINNVGLAVADILHFELNYENLIKTLMKGRQGQRPSGGFSPKTAFGVKMSTQTKRIGCTQLKAMVESNKLIVEDSDTIEEFSTFVQNLQSFAAEEGYHDDLVMALVLFGWLTSQRQFKENINSNIREVLEAEQERFLEEDMMPFGVYSNGLPSPEEDVIIEGENVWRGVSDRW